jgi:hypothetical protein
MDFITPTNISSGLTILLIFTVFFREYRSGGNTLHKENIKLQEENISYHKERNNILETSLKEQQVQINQNAIDIATLRAESQEKDKIIKSLNETVLNRNPGLEKTLYSINKFLEEIHRQGVVQAGRTEEQTTMIKAQVKREDHIDKSTDSETGNIMRRNKKTI